MLFSGLFGIAMMKAVASLVYKIFLCVAVYKDATEHKYQNAVLWTVLTAIFGFIPAVIYVIFRYQKELEFVMCPHCGKMVSKKYPVCMFCKQPTNVGSSRALISEEVKKYLIVSGIFFIVKVVFESLMAVSGARQGFMINLF